MKKLLALSVVLVTLTCLVSAQDAPSFTVGGRLDAWFVPLQVTTIDDGTDTHTYVGTALGRDANGVGPRARLFLTGKTDILGLNVGLQFFPASLVNGTAVGTFGFDDNVEVWLQPVDWFKFDVGKFVVDPLRGKIGDNWMDGFTVKMRDGDAIFSRFKSQGFNGGDSVVGALASFMFGDLYVGALLPGLGQFSAQSDIYGTVNSTNGLESSDHVFERAQVGVGYTIQDIGVVRAQYVGANVKGDQSNPTNIVSSRIEVAFQLTAVQGLNLDVGAKIPLAFSEAKTWNATDAKWESNDDKNTYQAPMGVSLGAAYTAGDLVFTGRVDASFGGKYTPDGGKDTESALDVNAHLWPTYNLGFAKAGLDVGFEYIGETKVDGEKPTDKSGDGGTRIGVGFWLEKTWGPGTVKGGLAYRLAGEVNGTKEAGVFSIPLVFEYTF
jgi:hypothetical protein